MQLKGLAFFRSFQLHIVDMMEEFAMPLEPNTRSLADIISHRGPCTTKPPKESGGAQDGSKPSQGAPDNRPEPNRISAASMYPLLAPGSLFDMTRAFA